VAIGPGTAQAIRERFGTEPIVADVASAADIPAWLKANEINADRWLLPGAKKRAVDLEKLLPNSIRLDVYETIVGATEPDGSPLSPERIRELAALIPRSVVCFASPSAVEGFFKTFSNAQPKVVAVIGPTTAAAAQAHYERVQQAKTATLSDLYLLAEDAGKKRLKTLRSPRVFSKKGVSTLKNFC
jgi:uroporphyrinogen-III synthase